jgi:hypothetical protein
VLNSKFASYSLAPTTASDGRNGASAYARRTSRFDGLGVPTTRAMDRPSAVSAAGVGGAGFGGIVEEEEGEGAVMQDVGERQRWDLEALKDPNVDLDVCK